MEARTRVARVLLGLMAVVVVSACDATEQPTEPGGATEAQEARALSPQEYEGRGIESEFAALEARLPGFGGFYMDEAGDLVAYVRDVSDDARTAIADAFLTRGEERYRFVRDDGSMPTVRLVRGDYSISQLIDWSATIHESATEQHGVVQYDADERQNRVSLGVASDTDPSAVLGLATDLGIPEGAVSVYQMTRPVAAASLTDKVRPLVAGYRTNNSWFGSSWCSLGHPVTLSGTKYFLTASHCIPNYTGGTGADIYQDGNSITEKVGDVYSNPAWNTSGCGSGVDYCANADAALVDIDTGITADKKVAESSSIGTGNGAGNLTVGSTYTIGTQESSLASGTEVHRTGQTTGSTKGDIEATCVKISYNSAGTILEVTCATRGDFRADPGDSGGPVYRFRFPLVTTARSALGVVFAVNLNGDRKTWYSPIGELQTRLGSIQAF